jgi:diaminopimelate epimerase
MNTLAKPFQKFYTMQGSGNDFIVTNNRTAGIAQNLMPT